MAREVKIAILGNASDLSRAVRSADRDLGSLNTRVGGVGSKIATFGKVAAIGFGAAAVGAVALGKGFVDAATESMKVTKQTAAVIKSMGGASNLTAKQIADLSTKLSLQSGVDDELIQAGSNVLLTFGKVRDEVGKGNNIFTRATTNALDMSVALGTDLKSANIQLGKALNDPIKGITALGRAGVSFTQKQKDTIKSLVETGDTLGAQKIILGELDKQFGGSAAAQATAGEKLKVAWGNVQEQIGGVLLPVLEKVATFLAKALPGAFKAAGRVIGPIAKQIGAFFKSLFSGFTEDEGTKVERVALSIRDVLVNKLLPALKAVGGFIADKVLPAIRGLFDFLMDHKEILVGVAAAIAVGLVSAFVSWAIAAGAAAIATTAAMLPIIAVAVAIAALVAGVIYAYKHWGWFKDAVDAVARFLRDTLWPALQETWRIFTEKIVPVITMVITKVAGFIAKVIEVAGVVKDKFGAVVGWVQDAMGKVGRAIDTALGPIDELISKLLRIPGLNAAAFPGAKGVGTLSGSVYGGGRMRARSLGGPVRAGVPYIVGEKRPEVFVPNVSGRILPSIAQRGNAASPAHGDGWSGASAAPVIVLELDGVELGRVLMDALPRAERHRGRIQTR